MDEHIQDAKAYIQGLESIQKNLREGGNQETPEIRYADRVSDFQEKIMILLNTFNIQSKS
jgi:hypothetical protein